MSSEKMLNSKKIIEKLKNKLKIQSESQLAEYLGINQSTLASWKSNNNFDILRVYDKIKDIDLNWLLGDGIVEYQYSDNNEYSIKEQAEKYQLKIYELEKQLKKTDAECGKDNKEVARLNSEILELRAKLEFATSMIDKLISKSMP